MSTPQEDTEELRRQWQQLQAQLNHADGSGILQGIITFLRFLFDTFLGGADQQGEDDDHTPEPPQSAISAGRALIDSHALPHWQTYQQEHRGQPVTFSSPIAGAAQCTSNFGHRTAPRAGASTEHKGVDLGARGSDRSPNILAAADGIVLYSGRARGYGNAVIIGHADGSQTIYGHLTGAQMPAVGSEVARGQVIGVMGNEGISTATHLHFEVRVDGQAIQPMINGVAVRPGMMLDGTSLPNLAASGVTGGDSHSQPASPMRVAHTAVGSWFARS